MKAFEYYAPTDVFFGEGTEAKAGELVKRYGGSRVAIVYGGGSVVRSGLLKTVEASLKEKGLTFLEIGGARPNPTLAFALEAIDKAKAFEADFVLAVGGGSAIDTAKGLAHGLANPEADLWDIWTGAYKLTRTTPFGVVVTMPAAGSEMSDSAVLTNEAISVKAGLSTNFNRCLFAILDPALCATLPDYQMAAGITDIMMHTMERYFIPDSHALLTDEIAEGLLRTVISQGRLVMADRSDKEAMGEVMWCAALSHNDLTHMGRVKDFSVHKFGHVLSVFYGAAHGASLAAVWKSWALYLYEDCLPRFARFARKVWGVTLENDAEAALKGIELTNAFFKEIGMPTSLSELGAHPSDEEIRRLALAVTKNDTLRLSKIRPIGAKEAEDILVMAR